MQLVVARIGKAHGLNGDVALDVRTDLPEERLAPGKTLATEPSDVGPLTVARLHANSGRWIAAFDQAQDRTAVEGLRGVELVIEVDESDEDDAWYPHQLQGLRACLADGTVVGTVTGLIHGAAHDLLEIAETLEGGTTRTLIPFVEIMVPIVDVDGGRVVLTPPGGLLARDAAALVVSEETGASTRQAAGEGV
jgi:16S rRNA processing protein RimM